LYDSGKHYIFLITYSNKVLMFRPCGTTFKAPGDFFNALVYFSEVNQTLQKQIL
jgi:hypothetical protein